MPLYSYINDSTGEIVELLQSIHDQHRYIIDGEEWRRIWNVPQISIDTKIDPFSSKQFLEKTSNGGTIGDLWDRSKELSYLRAEKEGFDPIKAKFESQQTEKDKKIKISRKKNKK